MRNSLSLKAGLLTGVTLLLHGACAPAEAGRVLLAFHGAANRLEDAPIPAGTNAGVGSLEPGGTGFDAQIGYRCSRAVPLRLSFGHTRHETSDPATPFADTHVLLEVDYAFAAGRPWRPYLSAGIGGIYLHPDRFLPNVEMRGGLATAGGGFLYRLSDHFSMDLSARAEFINWTRMKTRVLNSDGSTVTLETPIQHRAHAGRVAFGIIWWL